MTLTKYKLGDLIYEITRKNNNLEYGMEYVRGVSNSKEIMPTKADVDPSVIYKFYVVLPNEFVYNPRTTRMGDKVGLAYNDTSSPLLFTFNNIAFGIKESAKNIILSDFLFMYYNRSEFDRYAMINSWGSATELFSFEEMCDIDISIPSLSVQQKYVDIYNAMLANQRSYERGLEDLKLVCDAYIENLRNTYRPEIIKPYITDLNNRNSNLDITAVQGVNNTSSFGDTKVDLKGIDLRKYKIVRNRQFAYNPSRINLGSIALQQTEDCVVSPMYIVFEVTDKEKLLPEYLMMWFGRKEFQRSTLFYATGSVRDTFSFNDMQNVKIPIPEISIQQSIANIYSVYITRKRINERLKAHLKNLCSILIKGAVEEGAKNGL